MSKRVGIYQITSPSSKVYIGQSCDIDRRWAAYHNGYSKRQAKLHNSFLKYGVSAHVFAVVHLVQDDIGQDELNTLEQFYLDERRNAGFGLLNLREAGCSGRHSDESRIRMKGKLGKWMTGRKLSVESIQKRAAKQKGMKRTEESKQRYAESKRGDKNPSHGKHPWNYGLAGFLKGRKVSDATRAKQSVAQQARYKSNPAPKRGPMSEELKRKIGAAISATKQAKKRAKEQACLLF